MDQGDQTRPSCLMPIRGIALDISTITALVRWVIRANRGIEAFYFIDLLQYLPEDLEISMQCIHQRNLVE